MKEFRPSDVRLDTSFPPLCATMGRVEREAAATLMVRVCQLSGDRWLPVEPRAIGRTWRGDLEAGVEPLASLAGNPFWRPDFHDLVAKGFARFTTDDAEGGPIEFTDAGLDALRPHVRAP